MVDTGGQVTVIDPSLPSELNLKAQRAPYRPRRLIPSGSNRLRLVPTCLSPRMGATVMVSCATNGTTIQEASWQLLSPSAAQKTATEVQYSHGSRSLSLPPLCQIATAGGTVRFNVKWY